MLAVPLKPAAGVKVTVPSGLTTTVPSAGATLAAVTVSGSLSGSVSLASTLIVTGVSAGVVALSGLATGGWLTGAAATSTVTVAVSVPPLPSLTE